MKTKNISGEKTNKPFIFFNVTDFFVIVTVVSYFLNNYNTKYTNFRT